MVVNPLTPQIFHPGSRQALKQAIEPSTTPSVQTQSDPKNLHIIAGIALLIASSAGAQTQPDLPWHLQAYEVSGIPGIALPQALELLANEKPAGKVKVAVLDTGMELDHRAFAGALHKNTGEIPANGIDDDSNGYIDDVVGWNFLVDSLGQNLHFARYEAAYIAHLHDSLTESNLPLPQWLKAMDMDLVRDEYEKLLEFDEECWFWTSVYMDYAEPFHFAKNAYPESFADVWYARRDLDLDRHQRSFLKLLCKDEIRMEDVEYYVYQSIDLDQYWLNPDYNPRSTNEPEAFYGNNRCDERIQDHGTHVAGIIGGNRYPGAESFGVASGLVEILPVRMVVDGDELDKDVANAIRYAVDQGAQIINMSFGKYVSTHPDSVRQALQYAADHDVLLVHAAGNDATNIDNYPFYPNPGRLRSVDSIFINVGASSSQFDEALLAEFSNYGKRKVDVFAPGIDILAAGLNGEFVENSGTSMAAPVVAGVAALLRAYFPEFTAAEIKEILLDSVLEPDFRVVVPGVDILESSVGQPMKKFCAAGGIVNARQAVIVAFDYRAEKAEEALANGINLN